MLEPPVIIPAPLAIIQYFRRSRRQAVDMVLRRLQIQMVEQVVLVVALPEGRAQINQGALVTHHQLLLLKGIVVEVVFQVAVVQVAVVLLRLVRL
jgi:hypothetical protein